MPFTASRTTPFRFRMRPPICTFLALCVFLSITSSTAAPRRLIIDGSKRKSSQYLFAVSLMYCRKTSSGGLDCASFCSGSLIASNVVLTAGHCVFDPHLSSFQTDSPPVRLENMFVLVGSANWRQLDSPAGARLVGVRSVANAGFGKNHRYPLDDDVGLVFLKDCVPDIPGVIARAKLATDPSSLTTCARVTSVGFGRHANVPGELFLHDGRLRVLPAEAVHPFDVCVAAWKEVTNSTRSDLLESKQFCSGGDSVGSTCMGDSGGPVVVGGDLVVGVVSFGHPEACMNSPDFSARISTYANWIKDTVDQSGSVEKCPGGKVEDMFEAWPIPPAVASGEGIGGSRCDARKEWQCAVTGECVGLSSVCDGKNDCSDGSDERPGFCPATTSERKLMLASPAVLPAVSWIDSQFAHLQSLDHGDVTVGEAEFNGTTNGKLGVTILGLLEAPLVGGTFSRGSVTAAAGLSTNQTDSSQCDNTTFAEQVISRVQMCAFELNGVVAEIRLQRGYTDFVDPKATQLISKCEVASSCLLPGTSLEKGSLSSWYKPLQSCASSASQLGMTLKRVWEPLTFCAVRLPKFLDQNSTRSVYAETFNSKFGAQSCPAFTAEDEDEVDVSESANTKMREGSLLDANSAPVSPGGGLSVLAALFFSVLAVQ